MGSVHLGLDRRSAGTDRYRAFEQLLRLRELFGEILEPFTQARSFS